MSPCKFLNMRKRAMHSPPIKTWSFEHPACFCSIGQQGFLCQGCQSKQYPLFGRGGLWQTPVWQQCQLGWRRRHLNQGNKGTKAWKLHGLLLEPWWQTGAEAALPTAIRTWLLLIIVSVTVHNSKHQWLTLCSPIAWQDCARYTVTWWRESRSALQNIEPNEFPQL